MKIFGWHDDEVRRCKIPVFFHFGGFKNGVVYVGRGNYTEKYDKSGHLLETKWTRCSYSDNDIDYAAETWDAMTDGMYGDMPDGFDDDYSFFRTLRWFQKVITK